MKPTRIPNARPHPTRAYATALLAFATLTAAAQRPWSDPATWPSGEVPTAGERVVIPAGRHVVLDVDPPPLRSLTVAGELTFGDEADRELRAGWILVEGALRIGREDAPHRHRATITLDGPVEDVVHMGGRFLAVTTGTLELHGASRAKRSWTQLAASVDSQATRLTVLDAEGWAVGDELAIAPSGFAAEEVDRVAVTAIDGNALTVAPPLRYAHFGEVLSYGGKAIDCRAEVALLTRNVVIRSGDDAETERYGGHLMVMGDAGPIRLSGVRLERLGQPGRDARYSFHWHLAGDRTGDYLRDVTVVDALQRGVVVHGTRGVLVEDCAVVDVRNHAFVPAEDGDETGNRFVGNLAMLVRNPPREEFAFPRDNAGGSNQGEHRSSGFWLRNFDNELVGNHVAGVARGNGFFYDVMSRPQAFRHAEDELTEPITFRGNLAHSVSVPGVNNNAGSNVAMYGQVGHGMGIFVDNFPTDEAQQGLLIFEDFTAYKCDMSAVWSEIDEAEFVDLALADNATAFLTGPGQVRDAVVVGRSANPVGADNRKLRHGNDRAGYYTVAQGGSKRPRFSGVRFFGMHAGKDEEAAGFIVDYALSYADNYVEAVELTDSRPVWMEVRGAKGREPSGATLFDRDGSLTATGEPTLILPATSPLTREDCAWRPAWNAYLCPAGDYVDLRLRWHNRKRYGVHLVQEGGLPIVYGGGLGTKSLRMHAGESGTLVFRDYDEPQDELDLSFGAHAANAGGWGLLRLPYPFPGALVTAEATGDTIPRLGSAAAVEAAVRTAYYLDVAAGELLVKGYAPPDGRRNLLIRPGDQAVSVLPGPDPADALRALELAPNPYVAAATTLRFELSSTARVRIELRDVLGRLVAPISNGLREAGTHAVVLELPQRLPTGVYRVRVATDGQQRAVSLTVR